MTCVGYHSLILCSHQLKGQIVNELQSLADNDNDPRQPKAAWELSICYFSGFGISRDFFKSFHWLTFAATHGVPAAEEFRSKIRCAMEVNRRVSPEDQIQAADAAKGHVPQLQLSSGDTDFGADIYPEPDAVSQGSVAWPSGVIEEHELDSIDATDALKIRYADDADSDGSESTQEESLGVVTEEVISLVMANDTTALSTLIVNKPDLLNSKDREGNTLLVLAARHKRFRLMDFLLDQPNTDASICNLNQESALHVMSNFPGNQVQALVPRLVSKGADPFHEALPVSVDYESSLLNYSARTRCCPIFRSILNGNLVLFQCLLNQAHSNQDILTCSVCKAGSKLRRIVAIALSTF